MRMFQVPYFYQTLLCKNIDFSLSSYTTQNNNTMAPTLSREAKELAMAIVSDAIELFLAEDFARMRETFASQVEVHSAELLEDRAIHHQFEWEAERWQENIIDPYYEGVDETFRHYLFDKVVAGKYGDDEIVEELGRALGVNEEGTAREKCKCAACSREDSFDWHDYCNADKHNEEDPFFCYRSELEGYPIGLGFDYVWCTGYWQWSQEKGCWWCTCPSSSLSLCASDNDSGNDEEVAPDAEVWSRRREFIAEQAFSIARELLNLLADSKSGEFWDMSSSCSSVQALITDWDEALMSKLRT